jgi:heme-degrading monooxygenase HmoA
LNAAGNAGLDRTGVALNVSQRELRAPISGTHGAVRMILWNLRDGVSEAEMEGIVKAGHAILTQIPGVEGLSFGLAHESEVRHRYVVLIYFRDMDAVAAYDADPRHHAYVNNEFAPILADELVLTYALKL